MIALLCACVTLTGWAVFNRPRVEPLWPDVLQGIAFSPYQRGQDATLDQRPTLEQIDSDLALLEGKVHAVRTYSTLGSLGEVPRLAANHGLNVMLGAWLDRRRNHNEQEIERVIRLAKSRNVVRVIVGNETLHRGDLSTEELIAYLDRVRAAVSKPVSTADTWDVWVAHPELAAHVDFVAAHILPYWEGLDVERAVGFVGEKMDELRGLFPDKQIVIGEVGWPSEGRTRVRAEASVANEALFLRRFLRLAQDEGYVYYLMEAFDQPWKRRNEGAVGEYWGIYDVDRLPKFPLREPIVRIPGWQTLAGLSVAVSLLLLALFYRGSRTLATGGRTFLAVVVYTTATAAVWVIYDYTDQYLTATGVIVGGLLFAGMMGVIGVLLAEAHEWAEAHWFTSRRRQSASRTPPSDPVLPKVSIHVPAYNEPPEMMIETLNALNRLDYPDFEVIVVDNNTRDEQVWRPVQAHCLALGPRFRFFHVAPLAGFKAGALNFALNRTAHDAKVVAVIDSDYVIDPDWLRDLVPEFSNPEVALVQAPQDYRDGGDSAFKAMCYAEYRGFFGIGMVTRNERNAIIQHGTMTMVRRSALDRIGGWAEWCITEDAELGLRLFEDGYEASYIPRSYGRGLMPFKFADYKKQRYRWAYGAMQILKRHAAPLCRPRRSQLTPGQKYHFVAGWLPWVADGANLLFNFAALLWSAAMVGAPAIFDAPVIVFSLLPVSLFLFKLAKVAHLYLDRLGASPAQTLAAAIAGLALTHTIGAAVLRGLVSSDLPFQRTSKRQKPHAMYEAFTAAREEALMAGSLLLAALVLHMSADVYNPDFQMWIVVMLIQSVPYLAAVFTSLCSAFEFPPRYLGLDAPREDLLERAARATTQASATAGR